jgi:hypothetical protein
MRTATQTAAMAGQQPQGSSLARPRACRVCGRGMFGQRADARFCSNACRVRAHRGGTERRRRNAPQSRLEGRIAVTNAPRVPNLPEGTFVTDNVPSLSASKSGPCIVPDSKWPNMYRLRFADGHLSDMANLTRIKDVLRAVKESA